MALKSTKEAVRAICAADPTINAVQIKAALAELDGEGVREVTGETPPRSYSPEQVSQLLGVSRKLGAQCARGGLLAPICTGKQGKRARRYTGASVAAFLDGKAKEAAK